jgi:hypothetical protein
VTVGICLVAALLLLLSDYYGYSGVLLAVGAAAAVNLFGSRQSTVDTRQS